ncbi:hypothetical protein SAMN04487867_104161 [Vreelandella titanicae]|uniref:hypothetical protein n=1 Tax=Vreelandella titanicae TaxID=664683 RepID=UPI0008907C6F|nr:hypothetical protein [Halomonas titanicae]SDI29886.1 hypothetical protein SAMN04487867_104161 [Halomonas titanicae]
MEREYPAQAIIVRQMCDEPKCDGEMLRHGQSALMTDPTQFPHKYNQCGVERNYLEVYPSTRFRQI